MKKQDYANYRMYYIPHHFIFLPLLLLLSGYGIWSVYHDVANQLAWKLFSLSIFCILYLTMMVRQHYALGNQDRIVRLEFRLRYFELAGKNSKLMENRLSFPQIAALRFAADEEFLSLIERTLSQNLNPIDIKKSIKNWQPDHTRI